MNENIKANQEIGGRRERVGSNIVNDESRRRDANVPSRVALDYDLRNIAPKINARFGNFAVEPAKIPAANI
jgi:hypothetical protein